MEFALNFLEIEKEEYPRIDRKYMSDPKVKKQADDSDYEIKLRLLCT
jgi:hypothetical protein